MIIKMRQYFACHKSHLMLFFYYSTIEILTCIYELQVYIQKDKSPTICRSISEEWSCNFTKIQEIYDKKTTLFLTLMCLQVQNWQTKLIHAKHRYVQSHYSVNNDKEHKNTIVQKKFMSHLLEYYIIQQKKIVISNQVKARISQYDICDVYYMLLLFYLKQKVIKW